MATPAGHYELIVTHFFLDLFTPYSISRIVEKISRLATEDALWINVDFGSENQNLRQKLLMWMQYRFFRISAGIQASRLFDAFPHIRQAGWQILETMSVESGWMSAHLMCRQHKGTIKNVDSSIASDSKLKCFLHLGVRSS